MKVRLQFILTYNDILYEHKAGFRKSYSTNLALIKAGNLMYSNLHNGHYGIGFYLDLQKAFDTVNHEI